MDLTLREIQTNLPWTVHYSQDFRLNPQSHKDFSHALIHTIKACGKISEYIDNLDHSRESPLSNDLDKYIADIVICALRMANTNPSRIIDLQKSVIERLETKNNIKININKKSKFTKGQFLIREWSEENGGEIDLCKFKKEKDPDNFLLSKFYRIVNDKIMYVNNELYSISYYDSRMSMQFRPLTDEETEKYSLIISEYNAIKK